VSHCATSPVLTRRRPNGVDLVVERARDVQIGHRATPIDAVRQSVVRTRLQICVTMFDELVQGLRCQTHQLEMIRGTSDSEHQTLLVPIFAASVAQ
jgi:hypothetical protein